MFSKLPGKRESIQLGLITASMGGAKGVANGDHSIVFYSSNEVYKEGPGSGQQSRLFLPSRTNKKPEFWASRGRRGIKRGSGKVPGRGRIEWKNKSRGVARTTSRSLLILKKGKKLSAPIKYQSLREETVRSCGVQKGEAGSKNVTISLHRCRTSK